ncbi:hypothetical protein TEU_03385 [Thermococcus eurythermalis]|uniref:Uncharacterized protein n=1 Tax=Thermococcus eurythermalis TaxID=1505907 RepID=A0A097QSN5_9EURY|nr:hypothetical protein [Thermococcus eurythermalis]AIU69464.1 hypothetical protein TEU_03385 [Thermococcus eurythermalis]
MTEIIKKDDLYAIHTATSIALILSIIIAVIALYGILEKAITENIVQLLFLINSVEFVILKSTVDDVAEKLKEVRE